MVIDLTGTLANIKRHDYLPFGEELLAPAGGRSTSLGYTGGDGVRQQFTQKERDIETGLDYFLARYYSSTQGRFTSPDEFSGGPDELYYFAEDASANPTFYADLTNPQSLNKYQYAYNNPLRFVDPDGHEPTPDPEPQDPCSCTLTPKQLAELKRDLEKLDEATSKPLYPITDIIGTSKPPTIGPIELANDPTVAPVPTIQANPWARPQTGTPPTQNKRPIPPPAPMQTTEEKKKNLADAQKKGIPGSQLGPSGKPKVNVVRHPTEKRAKDAARNSGQGKPAKDASPKKGGPHYHPTNRDGSRKKGKGNVHHEYPN